MRVLQMNTNLPEAKEWAALCYEDNEFMLAARHWNGGVTIAVGDRELSFGVSAGQPETVIKHPAGIIKFSGSDAVWAKVLAAKPTRFNNDLIANIMQGQGLARKCDPVVGAQYYPAMARAIELLRPKHSVEDTPMAHDMRADAVFDAPVGKYVHLTLGGYKHRIYFEEAGEGIPLLLQHTAGCHGSQWRHLFEMPEITSRFRLIAYDLPCHGKSLPPVEQAWWNEQYLLRGEFLRSVPLALSSALELHNPVFMGCSVGGLLALDLAHKHADDFRAVISIEGALEIPGAMEHNTELWHPQVSSEYKARLMDGLMSPASPKRYRKETSFIYASGWPPVFLGDLFYYLEDYDLRTTAAEIDTNKVGVHILSGEYDCSGTAELGEAAHLAIPGSSFKVMEDVGHFPMSENPAAFKTYLLPILDQIQAQETDLTISG